MNIEIGLAVALDDADTVVQHRNVPTDGGTVGKDSMCPAGDFEDIRPEGQDTPDKGGAGHRMSVTPADRRPDPLPTRPVARSTGAASPPWWKLSTTEFVPIAIRKAAFVASNPPFSSR